jgi:hypothetical protein
MCVLNVIWGVLSVPQASRKIKGSTAKSDVKLLLEPNGCWARDCLLLMILSTQMKECAVAMYTQRVCIGSRE